MAQTEVFSHFLAGTKAEKAILDIPGAEKIADHAEGSLFQVPSAAFPRTRESSKEEKELPGRPETGWPTLVALYSDDYSTPG